MATFQPKRSSEVAWISRKKEGFAVHVRAFSKLMIRLRSDLGSDLDHALILAVIAERYYAALDAGMQPGGSQGRGRCAINAHSVALYAGIPRETARRKIAALVRKGWADGDPAGNLSPTAKAAKDLANATAASVSYLSDVTQIDWPSAASRPEKDTT